MIFSKTAFIQSSRIVFKKRREEEGGLTAATLSRRKMGTDGQHNGGP